MVVGSLRNTLILFSPKVTDLGCFRTGCCCCCTLGPLLPPPLLLLLLLL